MDAATATLEMPAVPSGRQEHIAVLAAVANRYRLAELQSLGLASAAEHIDPMSPAVRVHRTEAWEAGELARKYAALLADAREREAGRS